MSRVAPRARGMGRCIHWLESTGSTNDVAARLAESGAEQGTIVVADMQTAGRGRHGRVMVFAAGRRIVRVDHHSARDLRWRAKSGPAALLTLAAGVAIAEAVRGLTGLPAKIKWPNDVVVGRRKLAGILAEAAMQGGALQHIVLGFGVNLRSAAYPPELTARTTSIEAETNRPADRAIDACRNRCGAGRSLRRSPGRKVRCYSERLATDCGARPWRARRMGLAPWRRLRTCGRYRSSRCFAGTRRGKARARGRWRSAVDRLKAGELRLKTHAISH